MMTRQTGDRPIVHVVDDSPSLRGALASLLDSVDLCARTYESAQDFLNTGLIDSAGCVIIDVRLPGMNGLELQSKLSDMGVEMPVVLMTAHGDIPMSVRAMKRGAVDFLAKPFRDQDMLDAVMAALNRDQQRRRLESDIADLQKRFGTLSSRERQIMLLVTSGKMNKQIAWDLGISEITVKVHRGLAMKKMKARTLPELVRMADIVRHMRLNDSSQLHS